MIVLFEDTVNILGVLDYLLFLSNVTIVCNLQPGHDFVLSPGLIDLKQQRCRNDIHAS